MTAANETPGSTRNLILQALQDAKGLHKSELCRRTGRGWGTIGHHVYVLIETKQIITEVHGRKLWLFLPDIPKLERDWIVAMHVPDRVRLWERLTGRSGVTIEALSKEMEVSKKVLRTHLRHLKRVAAVSRTNDSPAEYEGHSKPDSRQPAK